MLGVPIHINDIYVIQNIFTYIGRGNINDPLEKPSQYTKYIKALSSSKQH